MQKFEMYIILCNLSATTRVIQAFFLQVLKQTSKRLGETISLYFKKHQQKNRKKKYVSYDDVSRDFLKTKVFFYIQFR